MAWRQVLPMEERARFVLEVAEGEWSFRSLCEVYGISRKTGYKWWHRYQAEGLEGVRERLSRPGSCPHRTSEEVEQRIIEERRRHPSWGPKKLRERLELRDSRLRYPALSTMGEILKRHGLTRARKRVRKPLRHWQSSYPAAEKPNEVWATDFKGWFRTGNGQRCEPLTVSDLYSRYIVGCTALPDQSYQKTRKVFESMFSDYGLPEALRMDNGTPFASRGLMGLSRLSVWWLQLGIRLEYIEPGHPEQNGIHERMHRTLKAETARPPKGTLRAQQRRFDEWRQEYNQQRPHEALRMRRPEQLYQASRRGYPKRLEGFDYPLSWEVRRVRRGGEIKWKNRRLFLSEVLSGLEVGLHEIEEGLYRVYLGELALGDLNYHDSKGLQPVASARQSQLKKRQKMLPRYPV